MDKHLESGIKFKSELDTHSFVVRIWKENRDDPNKTAIWRGWIRHVQTNKIKYFQNTSKICYIVGEYLIQDSEKDNAFEPIHISQEEPR